MAAIFVCPSPSSPNTATAPSPSFAMSHRRPLSTIQNGPNSPVVQGISKRARPAGLQSENIYAQPPSKKQAVERDEKSPRKSAVVTGGNEGKVFTKRNPNAPVSSFEKKLVASCEKAVNADRVLTNLASKPAAAEKERKARIEKSAESLESIRQWQRHYRKVFPQFVFYFESLPEDVRHKFSKQIAALGAVSLLAQRPSGEGTNFYRPKKSFSRKPLLTSSLLVQYPQKLTHRRRRQQQMMKPRL